MSDHVCPKCGGEVSCLAGEPAHRSNYYCDDVKCGWEAWNVSYKKPAPGRTDMDKQVAETLDDLDAAIFSGDSFHNREALKMLKWYLGRWTRESVSIEEHLDDIEKDL